MKNNTVCLSVGELYDIELYTGGVSVKEYKEDDKKWYDLIGSTGELLCMDGEVCNVVSISDGVATLENINSEVVFELDVRDLDTLSNDYSIGDMKTRDFLTSEEIEDIGKDCKDMFVNSFLYDGLVEEFILKGIEKAYGNDGARKVAQAFADSEFEETLEMSVEDFIEYYGCNERYVFNKWQDSQLIYRVDIYKNNVLIRSASFNSLEDII